MIQARTGSSRLPGKVLRRVGSQTVLTHVLARAKRVRGLSGVMVATTDNPRDNAVVNLCRGAGVRWVRGSERDVLSRYALAARVADADAVVRLTSDCPLLDPAVIDAVVRAYLSAQSLDVRPVYASNVRPPSWYDGCDVEVFSRAALLLADAAAAPDEREHVTTWMGKHPERVDVVNVAEPGGEDWSALKLSIDTATDYARVCRTYEHLRDRETFGWRDVVDAYARAFPDSASRRALDLFGDRRTVMPLRAAYVAGVHAGARYFRFAGAVGVTPNPYSSAEVPVRNAWAMGWEDVVELGKIDLAST